MAIAFDSAVEFSAEDQTTPTSSNAWTIASTADRYAISAMLTRDFGTTGTHNDMLIGTGGGDSMTQLGTTSTVGAGRFSRWDLYGSSLPAAGSSRILYGVISEEEAVAMIQAAVYNGVHQTTPVGDTDVATGGTEASTTIGPSDGLTLTLTTVSGDKVIGIIAITGSTPALTISSITGTGVTNRVSDSQQLEHLAIIEVDATTTSTTIAPTVTFSAANDTSFEMRAYVLQAAGGSGYTIVAGQGSYSLTGQTSNLLYPRTTTAEQGSYTLTGQSTGLIYTGAYSFTAEFGSYTLVGSTALVDISMNAEQGSYTLTGQDTTLTYTQLNNFSITAEQGSYALTGQATSFLFGRILTANQGAYSLTGIQAGFSYSGAPVAGGYSSQTMSFSRMRIGL
jgi:hypothetical protein